jgi:hypothetical protein
MRRARILLLLLSLLLGACGDPPPSKPALDPEMAALLSDLVDGDDQDKRMAAHKALPGYGAAVVAPLAEALDRPDVGAGVGAWIAEVLGSLGPVAEPAAPALYRRLMLGGDCSATTSWALGQIGAPAVPLLAKALASEHENTRMWAADALQDLGTTAAPAAAALEQALADPAAQVRAYALQALVAAEVAITEPAFERILLLTHDADELVRAGAAELLARARGGAPAVQVRLREMVLQGNEDDDYARAIVLEALDPTLGRDAEALSFLRLVEALPGEDHELRPAARRMLLERGVDDPDLVEAMADAPEGEGFEEVLGRVDALLQAGPRGRRAALPLLRRVLGWSPETEERVRAATMLGSLGAVAAADEETRALLQKHAAEDAEEPVVSAACRAALATFDKAR